MLRSPASLPAEPHLPLRPFGLRVAGPLLVLTCAATGLAACGGSSTSSTASPSTTAAAGAVTGARTNRLAAFDSCMESKGIPAAALPTGRRRAGAAGATPPSTVAGQAPGAGGFGGAGAGGGGGFARVPTSLPAGVTAAQYSAALTACRSTLPTFGTGTFTSPAFSAYRDCLQVHGVTFPARAPGTPAPSTAGGVTTTTISAATRQAATAACAALRPAAGAGGQGAPAAAGSSAAG